MAGADDETVVGEGVDEPGDVAGGTPSAWASARWVTGPSVLGTRARSDGLRSSGPPGLGSIDESGAAGDPVCEER